jgi:glycosyltransferase involved in cell wall biosynthesis
MADNPGRVAIMSPCFWPEVRRGGERLAYELASGLQELGATPEVLTSHLGMRKGWVENGVPVTAVSRVPKVEGYLRMRSIESHLAHLPFAAAALDAGDYDAAIAIYPTDAMVAGRWTARTGKPSVLAYMGIPDPAGLRLRRWRLGITQRAIASCSAVTALSQTAADAFKRYLDVDAEVISPGVDLDAFKVGTERDPLPTVICAAAVGEPRKRVELLIRALPAIRAARPRAQLVLSRPKDPALATALGEGNPGVVLADLDDRAALAAAYGSAWVSALPSFGEAFGLVLLEGLATGTPVVGANRDALPEVIADPAYGRLFDGDDPADVATAVLEAMDLAEDPQTRLRCRARAEEFSALRTAEGYADLLRRVAG